MKAVIFDFDGVILESAEVKTEAFQELFSQFPREAEELLEYHKANMGISRFVKFRYFYENILGRPYSDAMGEELSRRFTDLAYRRIIQAPFVKGAREFLEEYHRSLPCFIATGTPEEEIRQIAGDLGIDGFFREIHGSPRHKDEIVGDILNRYALPVREVVFVGDAHSDMRAAEANGIHFVARIAPYNREQLRNCLYRSEDLTELPEILRHIEIDTERKRDAE